MSGKIQFRLLILLGKVVICILMIECESRMPYGFYKFVRMFCTLLFSLCFLFEYQRDNYIMAFFSTIGFMLFNPIYPVILKSYDWHHIDGFVFIFCVIWVIYDIIRWVRDKRKLLHEYKNDVDLHIN